MKGWKCTWDGTYCFDVGDVGDVDGVDGVDGVDVDDTCRLYGCYLHTTTR